LVAVRSTTGSAPARSTRLATAAEVGVGLADAPGPQPVHEHAVAAVVRVVDATDTEVFGAWDQVSSIAMAMALPIAVWELSVGVYMAVKGFRSPEVAPESVEVAVASERSFSTAGV
jgi:hypothetical protein